MSNRPIRVGVFSDSHVGCAVPKAIGDLRRDAFRKAFTAAIDGFIAHGVDYVFHGGDLFERRTMTPEDTVFVKDELQRLINARGEIKIFIIRGNHDGTIENSALDYVRHPLAKYLVVLGDEDVEGRPEIFDNGEVAVQGMGYTTYPAAKLERVHDKLRVQFLCSKARYKFLIIHSFFEQQSGLPPQTPKHQILFSSAFMDIGFDFLFCGHMHRATPLMKLEGFYVLTPGALESVELSDETVHGYHILTLNGEPNDEFVPIRPAQTVRNLKVAAPDKQSEDWFIASGIDAAKRCVDEFHDRGLILRLILTGTVDGDKYHVEEKIFEALSKIKAASPNLLYCEIKNDLAMFSMPMELALAETPESVYPKIFELLPPEKQRKAVEIVEEVNGLLEEGASSVTGLLTDFSRKKIVEKWKALVGGG